MHTLGAIRSFSFFAPVASSLVSSTSKKKNRAHLLDEGAKTFKKCPSALPLKTTSLSTPAGCSPSPPLSRPSHSAAVAPRLVCSSLGTLTATSHRQGRVPRAARSCRSRRSWWRRPTTTAAAGSRLAERRAPRRPRCTTPMQTTPPLSSPPSLPSRLSPFQRC